MRVLVPILAGLALVPLAVQADRPTGGFMVLNRSQLNFGTVRSGTTRQRSFTIRNDSRREDLEVIVRLLDTPQHPFALIAGEGRARLSPGTEMQVTVAFTPHGRGPVGTVVHLRSSDTRVREFAVGASGIGK